MDAKKEPYTPNDDVKFIAGLRAPNQGEKKEEKDYIDKAVSDLDSFVKKTIRIVEEMDSVSPLSN